MDTQTIVIDVSFVIIPLIYALFYSKNAESSLHSNKNLINFLRVFLILLMFVFSLQIVVDVYFFRRNDFYIPLILFILCFLAFIRFSTEDIENKFYLIGILLICIVVTFIVSKPLYIKETSVTTRITNVIPLILFIVIFSTIVPLLMLYILKKVYSKKALIKEISDKELRVIIFYFGILISIFSILSLVTIFLTFDASIIFTGVDFGDVGNIIDVILFTISTDGLFIFTAVSTMFGALVTVVPMRATKMFGSMYMAFMPMLMFLQYFFGNIPSDITSLFSDFEWLGRVFYIMLTLMLITLILSAWKIFASIAESNVAVI